MHVTQDGKCARCGHDLFYFGGRATFSQVVRLSREGIEEVVDEEWEPVEGEFECLGCHHDPEEGPCHED